MKATAQPGPRRPPRAAGERRPGREVPAWYLGLCGLAAAQRWRELRLSRRQERLLSGPRAAAGDFPLMVAVHVGLFVLPPLEVAGRGSRSRRPALWVGMLAAASWLRWWSIRQLGPQWNVRAVVPDDLRPVTSGPYRYIRHPNYLAVILEFWALPMAGGASRSCAVLSLLNGWVLSRRIPAEESLLERHPGYRRAFAGKARLIPGIF